MEERDRRENIVNDLINKSLQTDMMPPLPDGFTDRLLRKIELRLAWNETVKEFFFKGLLICLLLGLAVAILFLPAFKEFLGMLTGFAAAWKWVLYPAILLVFTLAMDQLFLRYLFLRRDYKPKP